MKYIPDTDIDIVNSAVNFSTADLHVIGFCDVYAIKAAGSDKKLYRKIDTSLEEKYQSLVHLSASLSPPKDVREKSRTDNKSRRNPSIDLSRDTPFGNFGKISSRRVYAYMIASLNAAWPDYDFSLQLRPGDFVHEASLGGVCKIIDSTLCNLRPKQNMVAQNSAVPSSHASLVAASREIWSERMWRLIDKSMDLHRCDIYSWQPDIDPLEEEQRALWTMHYFFFNKVKKRVCYFHVRGCSVISHSPVVLAWSGKRKPIDISRGESAGKRANYWLGDKVSSDVEYDEGDWDHEAYESSDDEDVDRLRYTDPDALRNHISSGYWGISTDSNHDDVSAAPASVTEEIGDSMDI